MKWRRALQWGPAIFLSVSILSCKATPFPDESNQGDTLVVLEHEKLAPIDPLTTSSTLSATLIDIIFDGLIKLNEQFEPQPHLAESWERSADGRTWTFHLRKGVKFHDGSKMTADDVVYTFQRLAEKPQGSLYAAPLKKIQNIQLIDKHTIQITLKEPMASFLQMLGAPILPKHGEGGPAIGTGPFVLKSWSETGVLLEAHEDYFLGRPNLDRIKVLVEPNRGTAWAKLVGGDVDYYADVTPANHELVNNGVPAYSIHSIPNPFYYMIAFNHRDGLFRDRRIRRALNYAVDKEAIVAETLMGQGKPAAGTILPGSWAHNPGVNPYPYDPDKALALLKEAGWEDRNGDLLLDKDGESFEFTVHINRGDEIKKRALQSIERQLSRIGILMRVHYFDAAQLGFLFDKDFQACFVQIVAVPDPDTSYMFWHSSQTGSGFNVWSYENKKVDRLLQAGRSEFDIAGRSEIYREYQAEMIQDPPGIFLFWTNHLIAVQQRFKDVRMTPAAIFADITHWYVPKYQQRY